jgi:hypothetical protein
MKQNKTKQTLKSKAVKRESTFKQNAIHCDECDMGFLLDQGDTSSKSPPLSFHVATFVRGGKTGFEM